MKYEPVKNPNYVATIIRVNALEDLEGLDNLKGLRVFGMQALVSKDVQVGDVGVLFSTEVQLSEDFVSNNNLYRHTNLNKDPRTAGYLENSRRVRAIKLRGHRSDSLFMPLSSFSYLWKKGATEDALEKFFEVGDVFDNIEGVEILRKYYVKEPALNNGPAARIKRVDLKVFPMHIDSENYWRNQDKIPSDAPVVVTQKLHGTSVRYGVVPVSRDKPWYERAMNKLGIPTKKASYKLVVGSRKVVKSINYMAESAGKKHFYATDLWTKYAEAHDLGSVIPEGVIVYGELVGFTEDGQPIQPGYTYDESVGDMHLYVYRIATVTPSGVVTDLSWPATKSAAASMGMRVVPEVSTVMHQDLVVDNWIDIRYYEDWCTLAELFKDMPVPLSDADTVDEGVCVRYDGPNGIYILKAKSPLFLGYESQMLDSGESDTESEESNE